MARARIADIVTLASNMSGIAVAAILGPGRKRNVIRIRQACYYVARSNGHTFPQIGARMGRDHSSVVWGVNQAMNFAERDTEYAGFLFRLSDEASRVTPFSAEPEFVTVGRKPLRPSPPRVVLGPLQPKPEIQPSRRMKPKNDFRADKDESDNSHRFHDHIAQGSDSLLAALQQARAA